MLGLLLISLAYFGFWRRGCVCSVGSLQNVAQSLAEPLVLLTNDGVLADYGDVVKVV